MSHQLENAKNLYLRGIRDGITTENLIGSTGPLFLYSGTKLA